MQYRPNLDERQFHVLLLAMNYTLDDINVLSRQERKVLDGLRDTFKERKAYELAKKLLAAETPPNVEGNPTEVE